MKSVKYSELEVGDIILLEGKEFVFLGLDKSTIVGIHNNELHHYPTDFMRDPSEWTAELVRRNGD